MEMDNSKWRIWAKAVSLVDLGIFSLSLLVMLGKTFLYTDIMSQAESILNDPDVMRELESKGISKDEVDYEAIITWILWMVVAIYTVTVIFHLWAAIKLLNAAKIGKGVHEAVKNASTWRNVTAVFLVMAIFGGIGKFIRSDPSLISVNLFYIIWRIGSLVIVSKFMKEFDARAAIGQYQNSKLDSVPVNVIVKQ